MHTGIFSDWPSIASSVCFTFSSLPAECWHIADPGTYDEHVDGLKALAESFGFVVVKGLPLWLTLEEWMIDDFHNGDNRGASYGLAWQWSKIIETIDHASAF